MLSPALVWTDVGSWMEMVLLLPVHTVLPVLPVCLPLLWFISSHWVTARILALFHTRAAPCIADGSGTDAEASKGVGETDSQAGLADDVASRDSWDSGDTGVESVTTDQQLTDLKRRSLVFSIFLRCVRGTMGYMIRVSDPVQLLGSICVFAAIDKQGLLSMPSPSAESIIFFGAPQYVAHVRAAPLMRVKSNSQ